MRYGNEEWCKIWSKIDLPFQNWHEEFNKFWPKHLKISKNLHFNRLILAKLYNAYNYITYNLARKIDTKFEGKLACASKNWHEEFGKFSSEHLKVSKMGHWWGPFIQSRKCISLKFTEEFFVVTMKNDAKFEEELTCQFKIDMRNLTNVDLNTQKSQKFAL